MIYVSSLPSVQQVGS